MRRRLLALSSVCVVGGTAMSFAGASLGACSSFEATPADPTLDAEADAGVTTMTDAPVGPDSAPDAEADGPTTTTSAYRSAVIADSPIVYWRMGGTGRIVADETGRGNTLIVQGAADSFQVGVPGAVIGDPDTAIRFDGRAGRAVASDAGPFDFPSKTPFTIELWAAREAILGGAAFQYMLNHGDGPQQDRTAFSLQTVLDQVDGGVRATGFEYDAYDGGDTRVLGSLPTVGAWAHYAATFDGTNITVYVNGVAGASAAVKGPLTLSMTDLVVGGVTGNSFPGAIDEVAIYDHVLGAERIAVHITAAGR